LGAIRNGRPPGFESFKNLPPTTTNSNFDARQMVMSGTWEIRGGGDELTMEAAGHGAQSFVIHSKKSLAT
jgi:hypothetical protein